MTNILLAIGIVICMMSICLTTVLIALKKMLETQDTQTTLDIESIARNALQGNAFSMSVAQPVPVINITQEHAKVDTRILTFKKPNIKREIKDGRKTILSNERNVV